MTCKDQKWEKKWGMVYPNYNTIFFFPLTSTGSSRHNSFVFARVHETSWVVFFCDPNVKEVIEILLVLLTAWKKHSTNMSFHFVRLNLVQANKVQSWQLKQKHQESSVQYQNIVTLYLPLLIKTFHLSRIFWKLLRNEGTNNLFIWSKININVQFIINLFLPVKTNNNENK